MVKVKLRHGQHMLLSSWAMDRVMLTSTGVVVSGGVGASGVPELIKTNHVGGHGMSPFEDLGPKVDEEGIT